MDPTDLGPGTAIKLALSIIIHKACLSLRQVSKCHYG